MKSEEIKEIRDDLFDGLSDPRLRRIFEMAARCADCLYCGPKAPKGDVTVDVDGRDYEEIIKDPYGASEVT